MKNRKRMLKRRKNSSNHFPKYNLILHCSSHQVKHKILNLRANFLLVDRTLLSNNKIRISKTPLLQDRIRIRLNIQTLFLPSNKNCLFSNYSILRLLRCLDSNIQFKLIHSKMELLLLLKQTKILRLSTYHPPKLVHLLQGAQQTQHLQNHPSNFSFSQPQIQPDQTQNKSQAIPQAKSQLVPQQLVQQQPIRKQNNTQQSIPKSQQPIQVQISKQVMLQSKQKTPIQVQIEDFERKMIDRYNKEVVDLLKQFRDNLPTLQCLKDDLIANNVKWDKLDQLLSNSITSTSIQISQNQKKEEIREQLFKSKQVIGQFELHKDDQGLRQHEGQRLKDLLVFDDSREDNKQQFNKAHKQKYVTIDDKVIDILERTNSQEKKSSKSQELNKLIQRFSERVISLQSNAQRYQPQNNPRNKFLTKGGNFKANLIINQTKADIRVF
ncbi:UNKNOWN [Stylonychia lemnae]|uniref:Uncharacterized protein n=1 Tax=Stylonychia lemnae TaxID=5949 RepID=A0A078AYY1_STYLE|nr:UNKNOWN [Stylonychia lemnae]|eukprot:CDW86003.1 UNKNOWN [Stylonychia lemnae]